MSAFFALSGYFEDYLFSYNITGLLRRKKKAQDNEIVLFRVKVTAQVTSNLSGISSLAIDFTPGLCPASVSLTKGNCLGSKATQSFL